MDDLRLALLIAGIVIVAVIYGFARLSRRNAGPREDEPEFVAREPSREDGDSLDSSASLDPRPGEDAAGGRVDVGTLGGMFALRREGSDAELSVDVSILAGLRATYERTLDDALDHAPGGAPDHTLDSPLDHAPGGVPDHTPNRPPDGAPDHTLDSLLDYPLHGAPEGSVEASAPPSPPSPPAPSAPLHPLHPLHPLRPSRPRTPAPWRRWRST